MACADDSEILECAVRDDRIFLTLDEHFGDWAVLPLSSHPGVIRVKADPTTSSRVLANLLPFLERSADREFRDHRACGWGEMG